MVAPNKDKPKTAPPTTTKRLSIAAKATQPLNHLIFNYPLGQLKLKPHRLPQHLLPPPSTRGLTLEFIHSHLSTKYAGGSSGVPLCIHSCTRGGSMIPITFSVT